MDIFYFSALFLEQLLIIGLIGIKIAPFIKKEALS